MSRQQVPNTDILNNGVPLISAPDRVAGPLVLNSPLEVNTGGAAGLYPVVKLYAGGDGTGDTTGVHLYSKSGALGAEWWTTSTNWVTRIKSEGMIAFHTGAGSVGFTATNERMRLGTDGNLYLNNWLMLTHTPSGGMYPAFGATGDDKTAIYGGPSGLRFSSNTGQQLATFAGNAFYLDSYVENFIFSGPANASCNAYIKFGGSGSLGNAQASALRFYRGYDNVELGSLTGAGTFSIVGTAIVGGYVAVVGAPVTNCFTAPNQASANGIGMAYAWQTYSSERFKKSIRKITDYGDILDKISGIRYEHDNGQDYEHPTLIGFSAEEVDRVLPSLVSKGPDNRPVGLDIMRLNAVLWEAVKELRHRVAALEAA